VLRDLKISGVVDLCRTLPPAIAVGSDEATQVAERVQIYEYNEHSRLVTRHACAVCDAVKTLNKSLRLGLTLRCVRTINIQICGLG